MLAIKHQSRVMGAPRNRGWYVLQLDGVTPGKVDAALEDFNAALNVDNRNADSWALRGIALDRTGKKSEAQESFQRALALDGSNRTAKEGLSRTRGGIF